MWKNVKSNKELADRICAVNTQDIVFLLKRMAEHEQIQDAKIASLETKNTTYDAILSSLVG